MQFAQLEGQRVAVWGCGREGRAALAALRRRLPNLPLTLFCSAAEAADLAADEGVDVRTAAPDANALAAFDIIIKSPGISIYKPEVVAAQTRGTVFTSGTALWFGENPHARVIAVTGTKGKSTTAAMIAHMARRLGVRTALAGNIGLPLLELDGQQADLWVIELSSFQTAEAGPLDVGVILNLHEEHLDWHGSRERYFTDKLKLAAAAHTLLVNATQSLLLKRTAAHPHRALFGDAAGWHLSDRPAVSVAAATSASPRRRESMPDCCDESSVNPSSFPHRRQSGAGNREASVAMDSRLRGNDADEYRDTDQAPAFICRADQAVIPVSALSAPGAHNALNACAALAALELLGFDARAAARSLPSFHPLPHRLQRIGEHNGIVWINDSIATTPQATLAALESLAGNRITLIVGGYDRGLDWSGFAEAIKRWPNLRIITQGANGPRIAAALRQARSTTPVHEAADLEAAVTHARHSSARGDIIALSPGAPSFDRFRDYAERGRRFAQLAGFADTTSDTIQGLGIA